MPSNCGAGFQGSGAIPREWDRPGDPDRIRTGDLCLDRAVC